MLEVVKRASPRDDWMAIGSRNPAERWSFSMPTCR